MKSIYLTVIVILTSTVLTAQIQEVPLLGNPILQKLHHEEMAKLGVPDSPLNAALKVDCPNPDPDINYLFPMDTLIIELDTFNEQTYIIIDSSANIGTIEIRPTSIKFTAGNTTGAMREDFRMKRIVDGRDTFPLDVPIIVKRRNGSFNLPEEVLSPEENIFACTEPIGSLPGDVTCNNIFTCADTYGGNGLQTFFFESLDVDENCFNYISTRFPGRDTICVVLCDDFTVCDTFKQPFLIVGDTLDLPFFEDFSAGEIRPNSDRWLENLTFINQTMPYNPPSLGAATFDGLDASGRPYGGGNGTADRLTSKAFDLSKKDSTDKLVLSFYYQLKGRGYQPQLQDSLFVDFWSEDGKWVEEMVIPGVRLFPINTFPPFTFAAIEIKNPAYFHNGFQFRFRNESTRIGAYGVWHVDYIRLIENGDPNNKGFDDIAFSEPPKSVLNSYTAMPIHQLAGFEEKELSKTVTSKFYNNSNAPGNPGATKGFFTEELNGDAWSFFTLTNATNYPSQEIFEVTQTIPSVNYDEFLNDLKMRTNSNEKLELKMNYNLDLNQDPPALANDTACTLTPIDNYYAYDDGTAESGIVISGENTEIALAFDANVADTITHIKIHFPYRGSIFSTQSFDLLFWSNTDDLNNSKPDFEMLRLTPDQPGYLQSFATYELVDENGEPAPFPVSAGQFFVGIRNSSTATPAFSIGYDKNNPEATSNFWFNKDGANWVPYSSIVQFEGALMIRPIMRAQNADVASNNFVEKSDNTIGLYPNPAKEVINFKIENHTDESYNLQIFNTLGQIIHQDSLVSQLNISEYLPGIYFVKITSLKTGDVQNLQFFKDK